MGPKQIQPLQVRVELEVMAMKRYHTVHKTLELKPHYQKQFSIIPRTFVGDGCLLQIYIWHILQPQPTGYEDTLIPTNTFHSLNGYATLPVHFSSFLWWLFNYFKNIKTFLDKNFSTDDDLRSKLVKNN